MRKFIALRLGAPEPQGRTPGRSMGGTPTKWPAPRASRGLPSRAKPRMNPLPPQRGALQSYHALKSVAA